MEQTYIYADQGTGLSRLGLRATNLTSQLNSKKKYKNKTQSIMMLNSNFSKSRGHLDGMSIKSGNSTDMLSIYPQHQQQPQLQEQHQYQQYQPQHHQQQHQQQYQQQQQQQQQHPPPPQQLVMPKQRYRESFMYLNMNQQPQQQPQQPPHHQQQQHPSPELLQRRFSSQNGGAGIGSPMVYHSEEQARKLSLNALIGVPSDEITNDTHYMEQDWISIDEEEEEEEPKSSKTDETISRLQLENRNLKKKLKDIELGHDSHSIVANDEHYTRLEDQYNELSNNFELLELETKNLIEQNDAYFQEMTKLKDQLNKVNNSKDQLIEILNTTIQSAPKYIPNKSNFNQLFKTIQHNKAIPESIITSFNNSLQKFENSESKSNDNDIIKMLQFELRGLHESNKSLRKLLKDNNNIMTQKLSLERRTIMVAANQVSLHNEFNNSHHNFKQTWFNKIPTIEIIPSQQTLPAPPAIPSPQTPLSNSMHSLNSVVSGSTDNSEHEFHSLHSSIKSPLDIQYETFT